MDKKTYGISVCFNGQKKEHKIFSEELSSKRRNGDWFENSEEKYTEFLKGIKEKTGLNFELSIDTEKEMVNITEEGYIEPTPDPMVAYMEDLGTFNNIKTTHDLGLISDEEMEESSEYMKSIYPSEKSTLARIKMDKPIIFEKFRNYR